MFQRSIAVQQTTPKLNDLKQQLLVCTLLWADWTQLVVSLSISCRVSVTCQLGLLPSEGLSGLDVRDAALPCLVAGAGSGSSAGAVDWSTYNLSMWPGLLIVGQLGSQGSCPKRPRDKGEAAF